MPLIFYVTFYLPHQHSFIVSFFVYSAILGCRNTKKWGMQRGLKYCCFVINLTMRCHMLKLYLYSFLPGMLQQLPSLSCLLFCTQPDNSSFYSTLCFSKNLQRPSCFFFLIWLKHLYLVSQAHYNLLVHLFLSF